MTRVRAKNQSVIDKTFTIGNRRYIGGKSLLLTEIFNAIPDGLRKGTFCDLFAGTGIVGSSAFIHFDDVILNDLLYSNEIIYRGFFGAGTFSKKRLEMFHQDMLKRISLPIRENYFSRNFGRKYFSDSAAKAIGLIRESIESNSYQFNKREKSIALASLIYSSDRIANTVGHYEAYRKTESHFKEFEFRLIEPSRLLKAEIYRKDANQLAREIKTDVVYIDPPYNSRQYSRFYHVLETLAKWDKPELEGVALKPPTENSSEYCKAGAVDAFDELINSIKSSLIIVSYNNTYSSKSSSSKNKITLRQIDSIMKSKGKTKIRRVPHKHFSAGNTNFENHLEYIFITEVS
jgi:adenine-specific DNA-methyltransferase